MNSFKKRLYQFILITGAVILLMLAGQLVMEAELARQDNGARIINLAGRQRMLSQRLAMTVLYAKEEFTQTGHISSRTLDSLNHISAQWRNSHFFLLNKGSNASQAGEARSLLQTNTPRLERIYSACQALAGNPDNKTLEKALVALKRDESVYLLTAEKTVWAYEREIFERLKNTKRTAMILSAAAAALLLLQLFYVFLPVLRRLTSINRDIAEIRMDLSHTKNELRESEQDIRNNLSYIRLLQSELQLREEQFQKVIEDISVMMYELDEHGKFVYANSVLEKISGYPKGELFKKYYWDMVHPTYKEKVTDFYKKQRRELRESSYLEFSIVAKSGSEIRIGQHVRMFFNGKWVTKVMVIARQL